MKRALAILVGVAALAGCGGAHVSVGVVPPPYVSPDTKAIRMARKSNMELFRIFPREAGKRACAIPAGSPRWTVKGTCESSTYNPPLMNLEPECYPTIVVFRESWGSRHSASWEVPVGGTEVGELPDVGCSRPSAGTSEHHGERPPQMGFAQAG
jgi:hypothetical protein